MARYPTIGLAAARSLVVPLLDGTPVDFTEHVVYSGDDAEQLLDLTSLEALSSGLQSRLDELEKDNDGRRNADTLEGQLAIELYATLDPTRIPLETLDDPGFWRYVGFRHLWPFVAWREPALAPGAEWSKVAPYVDGRRASECVVLRMFIRASIAHEAGSIELATAVPRATDFWRSHLVRVGTGSVSPLAGAFIATQARDRLPAESVRVTAKRINRTRINVLMHEYTDTEAEQFVRSVW